ncbi:MAG: 30S ribosomal protein S4 [Patescibacteria group bacterium]|nr:30S ribosomal protein S4 [Patescibacteria group bacterium]
MFVPKEKRERSLGEHLQLKAHRCATPKCAFVRKPHRPGMHGLSRRFPKALSEFGLQLREKQKFKVSYGIDERGLRVLFEEARQARGSTAQKLIELLERRLDNTLFRLGLGQSRAASRQAVVHGHVMVNGVITRSPGFVVKVGDIIAIKEASHSRGAFLHVKDPQWKYDEPAWLTLDKSKFEGRVVALPVDVESPFEVKLVVEAFSK